MLNEIVHSPGYDYRTESYESALVLEWRGAPVNKVEGAPPSGSHWVSEGEAEGEFITWVTPFNGQNRLSDTTVTYGNEAYAGFIYCSPCLIVRIAAAIDRM